MKKYAAACGMVLAIALWPASVAIADTFGSFGIVPLRAAGDTRTAAYFDYTLEPGASISDAAVVLNDAAQPLTLRLYAGDAATATNGGTTFAGPTEVRSGTRSWLASSVTSVDVPARGRVAVPFTVRVPADATAGDHIAGWVVEAPPSQIAGAGVNAQIVQRAGVAVVVTIPGPKSQKLAIGTACLNQESGSNYLQWPMANEGNAITRATGTLTLKAATGQELFSRPVEIGAVLPGDTSTLRLDSPAAIGPGSYVANLALALGDGARVTSTSAVSAAPSPANGCAPVDAASTSSAGSPTSQTGTGGSPLDLGRGDGGPTALALLALVAATAGGLGVAVPFILWQRFRAHRGRR